ncbi:LuxR C-terminal-related transcriptional regulator [Methanohalobium sp.]|uniref:LuxR C-terminal-related transcriptional regulator n=1 Tax=Methanohalobium sp. TaxID=2837493 RepID=UPI0025F33843|nr:LuxR C-terminal-related transcriptional regulator [Methanohalobium sp.]
MSLELTQEEYERFKHMQEKFDSLSNRGQQIPDWKQEQLYRLLREGKNNREISEELEISNRTVVKYKRRWGFR